MEPKYSEETLLKVCYVMGAVIMAVIGGISFCVCRVLKSIA